MKKIIAISTLVLLLFQVQAQDYYKDIQQVAEVFSGKSLSIDMEVWAYPTKDANQKNLLTKAVLRKNNDKYYSSHLDNEIIANEQQTLVVHHDQHKMTLYSAGKNTPKLSDMVATDIDQLKKGIESVNYLGSKNGIKSYEVFYKGGVIKKSIVSFNETSYHLNKITYFYAEDDEFVEIGMYKSEIIYKKVSEANPASSVFDIKKYIVSHSGEQKPAEKYKNYKVKVAY